MKKGKLQENKNLAQKRKEEEGNIFKKEAGNLAKKETSSYNF